jgi:magnesium-transporting ATPase (P-type)
VIERMAQVEAIVFDKTGTLTAGSAEAVTFHPATERTAKPTDVQESRPLQTDEAPARFAARKSLDTLAQTEGSPLRSPSPLPSPSGRGGAIDRRVQSWERPESPTAGLLSSLAPGERAGVRGNRLSVLQDRSEQEALLATVKSVHSEAKSSRWMNVSGTLPPNPATG